MSEARFHPEHADDNLGIPDDAGPRAIERIHKLIRERDALQARVNDMVSIGREIELAALKAAELADRGAKEAEARDVTKEQWDYVQTRLKLAEERGYRRGLEDAAKVAAAETEGGTIADGEWHAAWTACAEHITAEIVRMVERNGDINSPHSESGAVSKSET